MRQEIIANAVKEYKEFKGDVRIYNRKLHMAHKMGIITTEELHEIKRLTKEIFYAGLWGDIRRLDRVMMEAAEGGIQ